MSDIDARNAEFVDTYLTPNKNDRSSHSNGSESDIESDQSDMDDMESENRNILRKKKLLNRRINQLDEKMMDEIPHDLYEEYLAKNNLDEEMKEYVKISHINIDSSRRRTKPIITNSGTIKLDSNPLSMSGTKLTITTGNNHGLSIGDKISVSGIGYTKKSILTYSKYTVQNDDADNTVDTIKKYAVDIVRSLDDNSKIFMRFDIDPLFDLTTINALSDTGFSSSSSTLLGDNTDNLKDKEYDLSYSNIYVDISGFKSHNESTTVDGVALNWLNGRHRVYLAPRTENQSSVVELGKRIIGITDTIAHSDNDTVKSFYIKLPKEYSGETLGFGSCKIDIVFRYYGGIPINTLNAHFPIDRDSKKGYYIVTNTYNTKVEVTLDRKGYFSGGFGGSNVTAIKLDSIKSGHNSRNDYIIDLENTYSSVVEARIINTIFHNPRKTCRDDNSFEPSNNKIYWQNMDDDSTVYSISIPEGNYTSSTLKSKMELLFYQTQKNKIPINTSSSYTRNNYITVNIDTNTNITEFKSYKEAILKRPIVSISPNITPTETYDSANLESDYELTIKLTSHGLSVGDSVIISGAISTLGIPSSSINGTHTVSYITNKDLFIISLSGVNLNDTRRETNGGNKVYVFTPNMFRLRFDFDDTIGKQLGFRKIGEYSSITNYSNVITNDDAYMDELDKDEAGNSITIRRNAVNLYGYNYMLVSCEELDGIKNLGPVKKIFSKINLSTSSSMLVNSHIPLNVRYQKPIKKLDKLTFRFYTPEGNLVDFNGEDHSFIIEIKTLHRVPVGTDNYY